ncbi:PEP-CTERM system TPR-repeat protein PrsT [Thalassotalea sp. 1_MG-2023]|uniref:XrtA/PEP-CTERM system TPR-repeat protein PrsT n=1 Tax=Thalassotalea sp. 1_MG-2023 TaxID=3062680 RepID=UPI0026E17513|nr:XrtA/PEP-CTERM system TPR-repeat protein PrsT [Thalassotalea sp. 1_MG-2023]MDO6427832.1 PEP-CTERM system TPR-repeat protein PrsT [Thalassotalea sp. 1_MG-2023]
MNQFTQYTFCFLLTLTSVGIEAAEYTSQPYENALKSFYVDDLNEAVIHLKNALKNNPDHLPSRILMAEILIAQGNGAAAEIELNNAKQQNADEKKLTPLFLEAYLLQNQYEKVINNATLTLGDTKLNSQILVLKGRALFKKNNASLAAIEYRKALSLNENNGDALMGLAQVAHKKKQFNEVLSLTEQALNVSPLDINALRMQAEVYQLQGKLDLAEQAISNAISLNDHHIPALLTRASILIEQRQYQIALEDVNTILKEIPNEPRANFLKAVITYTLGMDEAFKETTSHLEVVLSGLPKDVMDENPIYHYLAGVVNFNQQQMLKADESLRKYLAIISDDVRALKLQAKVSMALNEYFNAKNNLVKARLITPNDQEIWSLLGKAYLATGDVEKASRYFQDVIAENPNSVAAKLDFANLLVVKGDYSNAIDLLQETEKLADNNQQLLQILANAYQYNRDYQSAEKVLKRLVEKQPENDFFYQQLGVVKGLLGDHQQAKTYFLKAADLAPNNVKTTIHLARIELMAGNVTDARNIIEQKLAKNNDQTSLLVELGDTYLSESNLEVASQYYEKAYSLERESSLAVSKVVDVHVLKNELTKAIEVLGNFINRNKANSALSHRLARLNMQIKDYEEAVRHFQIAVKDTENKSPVLLSFAQAQLQMQDQQSAILNLQKAIAWNENFFPPYSQLITLFAQRNEQEKAFNLIDALIEKVSVPGLEDTLKGEVLAQVGDTGQAIKRFEQSLKQDNSQRATLGLSNVYISINEHKKAVQLLSNWLDNNKQDLVIGVALASIYKQQENYDAAQNLYEKLLEMHGEKPSLLNNYAGVLIAQKQYQEAVTAAEKAYQLASNNIAIADTLAWAYTQNNQADKALPIFRNAIARESDNPEIKYHLAVSLIALERNAEAKMYLQEAVESTKDFTGKNEAKTLLSSLVL